MQLKLLKDYFWNLFGLTTPMIIGLFVIPKLIIGLGNELFGILSIIWILIGYFSVFDLGIGRALTQRVSYLKNRETVLKVCESIVTGGGVLIILGTLGGLVLLLISEKLSYHWLNLNEDLHHDVYNAFLIISATVPLVIFSNGLRGVLEAYLKFKVVSIIRLFYGIGNFLVPYIIYCFFGSDIVLISWSFFVMRILVCFLHLWLVSIEVKEKNISFNKNECIELMRFGSWMTLSNILSSTCENLDKFVLASKVSAANLAFYTVPFDMAGRILMVPAALSTVLFPNFSKLWSTSTVELRYIYKRSLLITMIFMFLISVFVGFTSEQLLALWINQEFSCNSSQIAVILAFGLFFNGTARIPFALIQSSGDSKITAKLHILESLIYLPIMYYAISKYGAVGAAYAWTLRVTVDSVAMFVIAHTKLKGK